MATDTLPYAIIAVNAPVRRSDLAPGEDAESYHYAIPPALRGRLQAGHLVRVPFGGRRLAGIVIRLAASAPVTEVREIEALIEEEPVVIPSQIALAAWMAREYLAPFGRALWSMLPPGTGRTSETWVEAAGEPLPAGTPLTPSQRAVWQALHGRGPVPARRVAHLARVAAWRPALDALVERGLVRRWQGDRPPAVRPKTELFLRALHLAAEGAGANGATAFRLPREGEGAGEAEPTLSPVEDREQVCLSAPMPDEGRRGSCCGPASPMGEKESGGDEGQGLAAIDRALKALARAPRQLAVYRYLVEQAPAAAGGWLPLSRIMEATGASRQTVMALCERGLLQVEEREVWRDPLAGREFVLSEPPRLTPEQERAVQAIGAALASRLHHTFLLHGVTGSGKTEVYLQATAIALAQGRRALILVPEIALTPQTIRRVAARFPGRVGVWHSRLSAGERYDQWRRAMQGRIDVIIGPRSALLAPMRDLGLIVVDEEHEPSYKQEITPRYHARDAAVALGRHTGACVVLGSATPDVVTAYRARTGAYTLLSLPQRVLTHRQQLEEQRARFGLPERLERLQPLADGQTRAGEPHPCGAPDAANLLYAPLPPVEVVDLRRELQAGNRSIFSRALVSAMAEALAAHEQVILFLNRRGSATFVICRDCGRALTCPRCQVSLTYHSAREELVCHHCNHHQAPPAICPHCLSRRIKYFGLGTQRVVEAVHEAFPQARVVRWDRDTAHRRGSHEEFLRRFIEHEADVMVGTQMIAKGLDLPLVTVVGVISADTTLHLPDYRAAERTFQLLTQVAGRAGRSPLGGRVIVQTYTPEHYAIRAASRHDYAGFLARELAFRRQHGYPPFGRLIRLTYADDDPSRARQQAVELAGRLQGEVRRQGLGALSIIGPAPCPLEKLRGQWRWQIILRGADPLPFLSATPIPRGWRVDVDPAGFM